MGEIEKTVHDQIAQMRKEQRDGLRNIEVTDLDAEFKQQTRTSIQPVYGVEIMFSTSEVMSNSVELNEREVLDLYDKLGAFIAERKGR